MGIFDAIKKRFPGVFKNLNKMKKGVFDPIKKRFGGKSVSSVPQEHRDELEVAREAYEKPADRKREIMGYTYDPSISAKRWAVYVDDANKKINLGFRGTVPTQIRDLGTDLAIGLTDTTRLDPKAFGRTIYMSEARKAYNAVKSKYPEHDITISGHSLGGKIAQQIGKEFDDNYVGFNPGGGNFAKGQVRNDSYMYRAPTDPISVGFAPDPRTITVKRPDFKIGVNHSLDYFF